MSTITAQYVLDCFKQTGLKPTGCTILSHDGRECCGLGAVAAAEGFRPSDDYHKDDRNQVIYDGMHEKYGRPWCSSFTAGWDDAWLQPKRVSVVPDMEAYQAGKDAARLMRAYT